MRGPIDRVSVEKCCRVVVGEEAALAICYVLADGRDGLAEGLVAQRALTIALRQLRAEQAESVAIFVACDREGERVSDYARAWGATEVRA